MTYQLYLRSFADSDGDGIGDLDGSPPAAGPHRRPRASTALWLNPCYPSPNRDGGYDVADYLAIDPLYGGDAGLRRAARARRTSAG